MSDRPAPKFQVGDEVYVLSHSVAPGKWLSGVIAEVEYRTDWIPKNTGRRLGDTWSYRVLGLSWSPERDVRKKHRPSTQSFTELLQSIQQPNKVKA